MVVVALEAFSVVVALETILVVVALEAILVVVALGSARVVVSLRAGGVVSPRVVVSRLLGASRDSVVVAAKPDREAVVVASREDTVVSRILCRSLQPPQERPSFVVVSRECVMNSRELLYLDAIVVASRGDVMESRELSRTARVGRGSGSLTHL